MKITFIKMFKLVAFVVIITSTTGNPRLDGRIVGGDDAIIENYPHQLTLQYLGRHVCGASWLGSKWAVTAAHCTDGDLSYVLSVIAGITSLKDEGQHVNVAKIHQHPLYNREYLDYDISVLELEEPIVFSGTSKPISLPILMGVNGSDPIEGTDAVCTGWGTLNEGGSASNTLQAVTVQIVGRDTCNEQYGAGSITQRMICAGVPEGGKDACQGDSGGPLIVGDELVGIVSWGYGCGRPSHAGVYSNVGALREFIYDVSGL